MALKSAWSCLRFNGPTASRALPVSRSERPTTNDQRRYFTNKTPPYFPPPTSARFPSAQETWAAPAHLSPLARTPANRPRDIPNKRNKVANATESDNKLPCRSCGLPKTAATRRGAWRAPHIDETHGGRAAKSAADAAASPPSPTTTQSASAIDRKPPPVPAVAGSILQCKAVSPAGSPPASHPCARSI